jgi:hypothetical protein
MRQDHVIHGYGSFLVRRVFLIIYFDIFNWFRGALDHLLTRIQLARRSIVDLLSRDLRRSGCLKNSRLIEKRRLLSLPVLLSMNARWFFGMVDTPRFRFPRIIALYCSICVARLSLSLWSSEQKNAIFSFADRLICYIGTQATAMPVEGAHL